MKNIGVLEISHTAWKIFSKNMKHKIWIFVAFEGLDDSKSAKDSGKRFRFAIPMFRWLSFAQIDFIVNYISCFIQLVLILGAKSYKKYLDTRPISRLILRCSLTSWFIFLSSSSILTETIIWSMILFFNSSWHFRNSWDSHLLSKRRLHRTAYPSENKDLCHSENSVNCVGFYAKQPTLAGLDCVCFFRRFDGMVPVWDCKRSELIFVVSLPYSTLFVRE